MRTSILPVLLSTLFYLPNFAFAEDYCVSTPDQLFAALTSAAQSTGASAIRMRTGTYILQGRLNYVATSDLHISGGWQGASGTCTTRVFDPDLTVLLDGVSGQVMRVVMPSNSFTTFTVTGLSFAAGVSTIFEASACLTVDTEVDSNAEVHIERNTFNACETSSTPGHALIVRARTATVYVSNNRFSNNVGIGAPVWLNGLGSSNVFFSNNTVTANRQPAAGTGLGGVLIEGLSTDLIVMGNNVLWNNGPGDDLFIRAGTPAILNNNLIGDFVPPAGIVNSGTLSTDPGFIGGTNFRPRVNAVIRNSGGSANGQLSIDLDGVARVQGGRIDRGAYEFSEMLINGFE